MIRVVVPVKIKQNMKEKCLEALAPLIEESRKEEGCLEYNFIETDTENFFYFIELWKSKEAFEFHTKTPHFLKYFPIIGEFKEFDIPVEIYETK